MRVSLMHTQYVSHLDKQERKSIVMTPDTIQRIAIIAARSVQKRCRVAGWLTDLSPEDREDWQQQAALAALNALAKKPDASEPYLQTAAIRGLVRWLFREWFGKSVREPDALNDHLDVSDVAHVSRWEPDESQMDALTDLLLWTRQKQGERGEQASRLETQIILYVCRGWSNKQIADELGLNNRQVNTYRQRVVRRLERVVHELRTDDPDWFDEPSGSVA
jgi:DNA-directed RNA polymerase specialized sigma24 family protein